MTYPPHPAALTSEPVETVAAASPKRSRKAWIIAGAAVVVVLVGAGVAAVINDAAKPSPLEAAQNACDPDHGGTQLADDGHTLIIDSQGKELGSGSLTFIELLCLQTELHMTQAVAAHMGDTRALDGRQEDSWEGFTASWTYHPDSGLDAIIRTV
ncbi:hypothetical protein [Actinoplanes sp. NPDC049118]|uniref:hypothetical protein n=1 Tax=Actinoplanes sp. NPDC049118 TaxID=3155769 RepID=UPI0033F99F61